MTFTLHTQLKKDCHEIGELTLCRLLLMNDKQYPWFILVPQRDNIREIYELTENEQQQLNQESTQLAQFLMTEFNGEKMNVAALGNMVPQLHVHHVVRFSSDPVWPAPVWGKLPTQAYTSNELNFTKQRLSSFLNS